MFRLSKCYLDLVTDRGTVLILYAARLRWGPVGFDYASLLHTDGGRPFRDESSLGHLDLPQLDEDVLTWCNSRLQVRGCWERDAAPVAQTLADGTSGTIRWTCHMPRARATVTCGGTELSGLGYAERLELTIPPSRLPFRELRWGRHLSPQHALVWIDWDGAPETRWVWLDGVAQGFSPARGGVAQGFSPARGGVAQGFSPARDTSNPEGLRYGLLRLSDSRDVRERRIFGLQEHKQVSRSAIVRDGVPLDSGWAIHEVVTRSEGRGPRSG